MSRISQKWESLLPGVNPFENFRLADFTRPEADKPSKGKTDPSAAPSQEANDSYATVDASRVLYIKSLIG